MAVAGCATCWLIPGRYCSAALRAAKLPRPDVVIGSSVHPFAAVAGALLARRYKVPFIFEVRDLWPQTLVDMGSLARRLFHDMGLAQVGALAIGEQRVPWCYCHGRGNT